MTKKELERKMFEIEAMPFMGDRPIIFSSEGYSLRRKFQAILDDLVTQWMKLDEEENNV